MKLSFINQLKRKFFNYNTIAVFTIIGALLTWWGIVPGTSLIIKILVHITLIMLWTAFTCTIVIFVEGIPAGDSLSVTPIFHRIHMRIGTVRTKKEIISSMNKDMNRILHFKLFKTLRMMTHTIMVDKILEKCGCSYQEAKDLVDRSKTVKKLSFAPNNEEFCEVSIKYLGKKKKTHLYYGPKVLQMKKLITK